MKTGNAKEGVILHVLLPQAIYNRWALRRLPIGPKLALSSKVRSSLQKHQFPKGGDVEMGGSSGKVVDKDTQTGNSSSYS